MRLKVSLPVLSYRLVKKFTLFRMLHGLVCIATGVEIPIKAQIGPNFKIEHGTGLVITGDAVIGKNVTVCHGVTIGDARGKPPIIGDYVWIGHHASVLGCKIGNGCRILPHSLVINDVPSGKTVGNGTAYIIESMG